MSSPPLPDALLRRAPADGRASATQTRARVARRRATGRGMTLIEVLISIALVALLTGGVLMGLGVLGGARLRLSATSITAAVRVAYNHASAASRPTRLVFDLDARKVWLEESDKSTMLLRKNELAGGAAAATDVEAEAIAAGARIIEGARAPRPGFRPASAFGFENDSGRSEKQLEDGVRFLSVEVAHDDASVEQGRAYLYFWPGGQTERAAIQLGLGDQPKDDDIVTIVVSPLTGKPTVESGRVAMPRPREEREESERTDPEG